MAQKFPPYPGEGDAFELLRVLNGIASGDKKYRDEVEAWLAKMAEAKQQALSDVREKARAVSEKQDKRESTLDDREARVVEAESTLQRRLSEQRDAHRTEMAEDHRKLDAERSEMKRTLGNLESELKTKLKTVDQQAKDLANRETAIAEKEAAAKRSQDQALEAKKKYEDLMTRIKNVTT